jgi:integrase
MQTNLRLVQPEIPTEMQRVHRAGRKSDADYGRADRKYLRPVEVEAMIKTAKRSRNGARDALMISLAYHHGLRVSELINLRWEAFDLKAGTIAINRKKGGADGVQHLAPADARALRALRSKADGAFVFVSERGGQLTRDGFAKMFAVVGERAGLDRRLCHPHALRHAAGHALANSGRVNAYQLQAIMGHRDPRGTAIYVQGVAGLIKGLWD